jgi:trimethylamine--corrinoid protein Co-methyltransferase
MREKRRQIGPLLVFSDYQLEEMHLASLEVLRRTGVQVAFPEAVDLLKEAGCWVDGEWVRIPPHLVEWAIKTAPKRVVLSDRNGNPSVYLEGYKSYYGTGSDCIFVIDPYTGKRREALLKDVADFAKLIDALPNMDFAMGMSVAHDVPEAVADIHQFYAMVSNTVKPIVYATWGPQNLKTIVEMCEVVAGGRRLSAAVPLPCCLAARSLLSFTLPTRRRVCSTRQERAYPMSSHRPHRQAAQAR